MSHKVSRGLVLATLGLLTVWTTSSTPGPTARGDTDAADSMAEQEQLSYYYFKEQRPLTLNVQRVAVFVNPVDAADESPNLPGLDAYGIDDNSVAPFTIPGWHLAQTKPEKQSAQAISQVVADIKEAKSTDFVSPVFVGLDGGPVIVTPYLLVGFHQEIDPARAEAILAESEAGVILDRDWANMTRVYRLKSASRSGFDVLAVANSLAKQAEVTFAEPDFIFTGRAALIPNDTLFGSMWGLHNTGQSLGLVDFDMDVPEAWDITTGDPSIIVLIIDNGVQQDHPDINQITPGIDTTSDGGDGGPVNACDNHGTPVAGCVSAIMNNNLGVAGVCPDCLTASARPFISTVPCDGSWNSIASWTVNALTWGEGLGVRVTNNSNFYGFTSSAIATKYNTMRNNGVVHFSSAGNFSSSSITYPANLPTVNAVAATNRFGNRTSFSNFGFGLAVSAPGQDIWSTDRTGTAGYNSGDYVSINGTSFASPYTAGVAALILSKNPSLDAFQVEDTIYQACVDMGVAGYDTSYGWGHVNARAALEVKSPAVGDDLCYSGTTAGSPCSATTDCTLGEICGNKNRYISIKPSNLPGAQMSSIEVCIASMPDFPARVGECWWAGPEISIPNAPHPTLAGAPLECTTTPHSSSAWTTGILHLYGAAIVPDAGYEIRMCDETGTSCSDPLVVTTGKWGDVAAPFGGSAQPNFGDVSALLDGFRGTVASPGVPRSDLVGSSSLGAPNPPNGLVNFADVSAGLEAFRSASFPYTVPECP